MLNFQRIQVLSLIAAAYCLQSFHCAALAADPPSDFDRTFGAGMKAYQEGKPAEGEKLLKETLKMEEKQGADEIKRSQSIMALADFYRLQKRYTEAEAMYKQLLAKFDN
ncbi:MAG: tetratricopeptide repeat protein, partial [Candidatus Obscuribacterales bacterium]|nr:tetratricopeptide repeat protein [Candidatus Obscuribacterales bacterium]